MKISTKKQVQKRMSYLIGHLKGVEKMVEANKYCIDVIQQNNAVISALKKVNQKLLSSHLETCVTRAVESKNTRQRKKIFDELLAIYKKKD